MLCVQHCLLETGYVSTIDIVITTAAAAESCVWYGCYAQMSECWEGSGEMLIAWEFDRERESDR